MKIQEFLKSQGMKAKTTRNAVLVIGVWILAFSLAIIIATTLALALSLRTSTANQAKHVKAMIERDALTAYISDVEPGAAVEVIDDSGAIISSSQGLIQLPNSNEEDALQDVPDASPQNDVEDNTEDSLQQQAPASVDDGTDEKHAPQAPSTNQNQAPAPAPVKPKDYSIAPPSVKDDDDNQGTDSSSDDADDDDDEDDDVDDEDDDDDRESSFRLNSQNKYAQLLQGNSLFPSAYAQEIDAISANPITQTVTPSANNLYVTDFSQFQPLSPGEQHVAFTFNERAGSYPPYVIYREGVMTKDGPVTIVAKESLLPIIRSAVTLTIILLVATPLALLLVARSVSKITDEALHPVDKLVDETRRITVGDLDRRLSVPQHDPELQKLAITMNSLLDGIQNSIKQRQQFISDASHELKSPIASISMILDVVERNPELMRSNGVVNDLRNEADRLQGIIADLVILARGEEVDAKSQKRSSFEAIDLYDLVQIEVASARTRGKHPIDTTKIEPVVMYGDSSSLSRLVRNLLDNADRFAQSKVWIELYSINDDDDVFLAVSDDGPGISEHDRTRIFERFVRLDPSRDRKMGGTGLGLPVVKTAAELHAGTVSATKRDGGGARFEVLLSADARK